MLGVQGGGVDMWIPIISDGTVVVEVEGLFVLI